MQQTLTAIDCGLCFCNITKQTKLFVRRS